MKFTTPNEAFIGARRTGSEIIPVLPGNRDMILNVKQLNIENVFYF